MRTPERCKILSDGRGGRFILPGCMGTVDRERDGVSPQEIIDIFCTCPRRPRYKRGEKARLERLRWRARRLEEEIDRIEREAREY